MTIHTFPGEAPARRVLSGNTASEEQRRIALAMMNDNYRYPPLPDAHNCDMLARMNGEGDTRPVIGWLLIAVVIGAALAVWVLV